MTDLRGFCLLYLCLITHAKCKDVNDCGHIHCTTMVRYIRVILASQQECDCRQMHSASAVYHTSPSPPLEGLCLINNGHGKPHRLACP